MMETIKKCIKDNRFIRGLYFLYRRYFGYSRRSFGFLDDHVRFTPPLTIDNPHNVYIYGSVTIGPAHISALNARFVMKKGCAVAGGLSVFTGNHARINGRFVGEITEQDKPSGYDHDVIIEEDVWIASYVTILQGVTIGRGTTVAAGAVVTRSMPPYCICGGVPAKFIKFYWTIDEILEHESKLYPEQERFSREQLEAFFKEQG